MSQLLGFGGPVAPIFRDPIKDTARKLAVSERVLFKLAADEYRDAKTGKPFTNPDECASYRFLRWHKHGEIPDWISKFIKERAR